LGIFKKKHDTKTDFELPLAPLASFFTVVLVFLIQSTSVGTNAFTPTDGVDLPTLSVGEDFTESLRFQVSAKSILINDKSVYSMTSDYQIPETDWKSIQEKISEELRIERGETIRNDGSKPKTRKLVLVADRKAPYEILKKLFSTASENGFLDLKLVIIKE
jgi:biopolymer transport protein ExbD